MYNKTLLLEIFESNIHKKKNTKQILHERMNISINEKDEWKNFMSSEEQKEIDLVNSELDKLEKIAGEKFKKYFALKDSGNDVSELRDELEKHEKLVKKYQSITKKIKNSNTSKYIESLAPNALANFDRVRLSVTQNDFPNYNNSNLYPKEYFPFLWDNPFYPDRINFNLLMDNPILIHTIWRGINPQELEYIREHKQIKSNQEYNIGYEVERGLTVFGTTPRTGISYAGGFAPQEYRPTDDNPNYLIQIKANQQQNELFYDSDEYIKTEKAIPSNQIEKIWEVDSNESTKEVSNILPL